MAGEHCRLCGGDAEHVFGLRMLDRFDVAYFRCRACDSLQTQRPHWLDIAYSEGDGGSAFDTGAAYRTRYCAAAVLTAYRLTGLRGPMLDFGGGSGLLCRTLRDCGVDAWTFDEYDSGHYARAFRAAAPTEQRFDLISAFEVLEHLPDPAVTLEQIFAVQPKVAVMSTERYRGGGPDWDYLAPFHGQHVFFYSLKAIDWIAARFGYRAYLRGNLFVFVRNDFARGHLMLRLMRRPLIKTVECAMPLFSGHWADRDGNLVRARRGVLTSTVAPQVSTTKAPPALKEQPADVKAA